MTSFRWRLLAMVLALFAAAPLAGCDLLFGPSGPEAKYEKALKVVNEKWTVYEVQTKGEMTIVRVEVDENVPFAQAKKAGEEIQKAEPSFTGYIEFFNSEVGMVLRKLEIFPAT